MSELGGTKPRRTPEEQARITAKAQATRIRNKAIKVEAARKEAEAAIENAGLGDQRKEPKQNSERFVEVPRYVAGMDKMIAESQVGGGKNLYISPMVLEDIKENNLVCRWGLDNEKGRMDKLYTQLWRPYTDSTGAQIIRPSGYKGRHILMVRDRGVHQRSMELKRKKRNAKVQAEAQSTEDHRYIAEGQSQVVTESISH